MKPGILAAGQGAKPRRSGAAWRPKDRGYIDELVDRTGQNDEFEDLGEGGDKK